MLKHLRSPNGIPERLGYALHVFHRDGPIDAAILEELAHIKQGHPDAFAAYERKLMSLMGLFYKTTEPTNMLETVYALYADAIEEETGQRFTPVQASAYNQIRDKKYFSFSAPTSSGKSFLFRSLIQEAHGDIVIVVPSRALIAEYFLEVTRLVGPNVLVLDFIENINTEKTDRRIFIITPERGVELFKRVGEFTVELFLLDEAQISEDTPTRTQRPCQRHPCGMPAARA